MSDLNRRDVLLSALALPLVNLPVAKTVEPVGACAVVPGECSWSTDRLMTPKDYLTHVLGYSDVEVTEVINAPFK
jgi:hypothetical protein